MITLTAEQAQQIEEALEDIVRVFKFETGTPVEALAVIRAARAQEQAEQKPVAYFLDVKAGFSSKPLYEQVSDEYKNDADAFPLYAATQPVQQEPMMDYERINALREGEQNGAEDAYFFVRPENDTPTLRKMFCQGFERGFHKGLKYAAPVQQVDLTDYEIVRLYAESPMCDSEMIAFARAVIAADREKNK